MVEKIKHYQYHECERYTDEERYTAWKKIIIYNLTMELYTNRSKERRGTEGGEEETIRNAFKKLMKRSFERRWIEKFLDNWDRCIEICLNSIFFMEKTIYTKSFKKILHL